MKKISFLLCLISAAAFFTGCATLKLAKETTSPMILLSVSSNRTIPYIEADIEDEEFTGKDGFIEAAINGFLMRENPEFITRQDRADLADETFRRIMEEIAEVPVVPKNTMIESEVYDSLNKSVLDLVDTQIRATDYKPLNTLGGKKSRMLMQELNAKSIAFVDFRFNKTIAKGHKFNGEVGAVVTMTVRVLDSRGKQVIEDTFVSYSQVTTPILKLEYDRDELIDMFPEVIENIINQFIIKYYF